MMIDFAEYPNTVFRFRPNSPLSLKELQYGELFFVSNDELNDPYDTKNPHFFEPNPSFYSRLIPSIMGPIAKVLKLDLSNLIDIEKIASFLGKEGRLQNELIQLLDTEEFAYLLQTTFSNEIRDLIPYFILAFKEKLLALGGICYIASFCKTHDDPVMWSHYSNHHKGFCMCFSINDRSLQSRESSNKKQTLFSNLKFEEVIYADRNVTANGMFLFTPDVAGIEWNEAATKEYWALRRQSYLTKFLSWQYEQEVRIIVDDWFNVRSSKNGKIKMPISERIFHYDQRQLTGIIFGARMPENDKNEIRHILYRMREELRTDGNILPIFLFYEAEENAREFRMNIEPLEGFDAINNFFRVEDYNNKLTMYNQLKAINERNVKTDSLK